MPLKAVIDHQYGDSQSMSRRPGMYLKYLPYSYDGISGQFNTGGSYLFDTYENAKKYEEWSSSEFELGDQKISFWKHPMFEMARYWTWKVIGACNFAPIEEHAVARLQRWKCQGSDAEGALREAYSSLKDAAKAQGAASIWLLYKPDENMVAIQMAFKKSPGDDFASAEKSLTAVEEQPSLENKFPKNLQLQPLYGYTRLLLTCWLPRSREAGGAEYTIPNYPVVPAITQSEG